MWTLIDDTVTCADGSKVASQADCPNPASQPGPGDDAAAAPKSSGGSATRQATCWNGQKVSRIGECSLPQGTKGLMWVYPSFKRDFGNCEEKIELNAGKDQAWFCRFGADAEEGVRYSAWGTLEDALTHYSNSYADDEPVDFLIDGSRAGYLWRRTTPKSNGIYRMSALYENWPFSISVEARSPEERERLYAAMTFRRPAEILGTTSGGNQS